MKEQTLKILLYILSLLIVILLIIPLFKLSNTILFSGILIGVVIMYSMLKHTIYRDSLIKSIINFAWVMIILVSGYLVIINYIALLIIFLLLIFVFMCMLFSKIKNGRARIGIEIFVEFIFYFTSLIAILVLALVYAILNTYIFAKLGDYEKIIKTFIQIYFIYAGLMVPHQFKLWLSSIISIDESIYSIEEQTELLNILIKKYDIKREYKLLTIEENDMQKVEMFIDQKVLQAITGTSNFEHYAQIGIELRLTAKGDTIKVSNLSNINQNRVSAWENVKAFFTTWNEMRLFGTLFSFFIALSVLFIVSLVIDAFQYIIIAFISHAAIVILLSITITVALIIGYVINRQNEKFNKRWDENKKKYTKKN